MTKPGEPDDQPDRPIDPEELEGEPPAEEPPVMPTAAEAAQRRSTLTAPASVRYALVVWPAAGVAGIVDWIIWLANKDRLIDFLIDRNRQPNVTKDDVAEGATTMLWMLLLAAVVFAVLFTLFAYKAQEGLRRARLILTVLCVIIVVFYVWLFREYIGLLVAGLAVLATVLLYLPKANEFFRADRPA